MRSSKFEFFTLFAFMVIACLVLTNGFTERIFAKDNSVDVYEKVEPIADVLDKIMTDYVRKPDINKVVEGALVGMMNSLDKHSSYVAPEALKDLTNDTEGQFDGVGIIISLDEEKNIVVTQPLPSSPAAKAGIRAGDYLIKIDQVDTKGMSLSDAAQRIKGPRGSMVHLTVFRKRDSADGQSKVLDFDVKRDIIPLESISDAHVMDGGVGYLRVSDFKKTTAHDMEESIKKMQKEGMKSLIIDLRWNPGGLLSASKQVCQLFLPKNTLVTYTRGRHHSNGQNDDLSLYTERAPILPTDFPLVLLINEYTASSSEIVTGALQFWSRAIVVGQKSYGKGSVQTVIPLRKPAGAALRLTTALYYTPAKVTIDNEGIKPDVNVPIDKKTEAIIYNRMLKNLAGEPENGKKDVELKKKSSDKNADDGAKSDEDKVEDIQLQRAVKILKEDSVFAHLVAKYHKDTHVTQTAAAETSIDELGRVPSQSDSDADMPLDVAPAEGQGNK